MRYLLATEERVMPLVLTGTQRAERGTKLLYLPAILRPVARALRGDGAIVRPLRLSKQVADRS